MPPVATVKGDRFVGELIPLTVPEVRRLLCRLLWLPRGSPALTIHWSGWRRRRQARALESITRDTFRHLLLKRDCNTSGGKERETPSIVQLRNRGLPGTCPQSIPVLRGYPSGLALRSKDMT